MGNMNVNALKQIWLSVLSEKENIIMIRKWCLYIKKKRQEKRNKALYTDPEFRKSFEKGVADMKEGRVTAVNNTEEIDALLSL